MSGKLPFRETYLGQIRQVIGSRLVQTPGFRIIIENEEGEVLLIKRRDRMLWGLPAGMPELKEPIEVCVKREVEEETSLKLLTFECFGFASNPACEVLTYPNGDVIHCYALLLHSTNWQGVARADGDEIAELGFFPLDSLPKQNEFYANEWRTIEDYRRYLLSHVFQWS